MAADRSGYTMGRGWGAGIPTVSRREELLRQQARSEQVRDGIRRAATFSDKGSSREPSPDTPRFGEGQQARAAAAHGTRPKAAGEAQQAQRKGYSASSWRNTPPPEDPSESGKQVRTLEFDGGTFEGEWVNGSACGEGTVLFRNGDSFVGEYANNRKHGRGIYRWADGSWEEGPYVKGLKHGWHRWCAAGELWDLEYVGGSLRKSIEVGHDDTPGSRAHMSGPLDEALRMAAEHYAAPPATAGRSPGAGRRGAPPGRE